MTENQLKQHAEYLNMDEPAWRASVLEELKKQTELINRNQRYVGILVLVVAAQIVATILCGQQII